MRDSEEEEGEKKIVAQGNYPVILDYLLMKIL
jgi:hypothetical protein